MSIFNYVIGILALTRLGACYLESDGWIRIDLQHALDYKNPNSFQYRGNVSIASLNSGHSNIRQETITDAERKSLLVFSENNDFYRVKATVFYANGHQQTFLTSARACSLVMSQLNDILWVAIDDTGYVTAITQTTSTTDPSSCKNIKLTAAGLEDFNTDVLIRHTELAPVCDTASFIQKVEREREARERGEGNQNQSFLAKYWMYLLPVVLLVFISGATNQGEKE